MSEVKYIQDQAQKCWRGHCSMKLQVYQILSINQHKMPTAGENFESCFINSIDFGALFQKSGSKFCKLYPLAPQNNFGCVCTSPQHPLGSMPSTLAGFIVNFFQFFLVQNDAFLVFLVPKMLNFVKDLISKMENYQ